MTQRLLVILLATGWMTLSIAGCGPASMDADDADFAEGAFPPTLSDTAYHERAWSRPTCLSCHENQLEGAPKIRHASLPPEAKLVKCRSCHVLVPDSRPRD